MIKGTRLLEGREAFQYRTVLNRMSTICSELGFNEIILPCLADPQLWYGRYRELTQFGVEILGLNPEQYEQNAKNVLKMYLDSFKDDYYEFDDEVVRGLSYYSRDGFEARCNTLGAQKQIAGGGTYKEGCGWAIGVDRLLLAINN